MSHSHLKSNTNAFLADTTLPEAAGEENGTRVAMGRGRERPWSTPPPPTTYPPHHEQRGPKARPKGTLTPYTKQHIIMRAMTFRCVIGLANL